MRVFSPLLQMRAVSRIGSNCDPNKEHGGHPKSSWREHRRSIAKVSEAHVERCNYPVSTASRFIRTSQARWTVADMTGAQSCHPAFRSSDDVAIRTTVLYTTIGTSRADDKVQLLAFLQRLNAERIPRLASFEPIALAITYYDPPVRIRARIERYPLASSARELFVLSLHPTIVLNAFMQRADENSRYPSIQREMR
ncbi:hypothetical protein KCU94_g185, partial [Aureobasidium melanogenum]